MAIPATRAQLVTAVRESYAKLVAELDEAGARAGSVVCEGEWTVRDVLVVRAWWTEQVVAWIEGGLAGERVVVPAPGYRWRDTPKLNAEVVRKARRESYRSVKARLQVGCARLLELVGELSEQQLLRVGVFDWTGKWAVARWVSINTATQYETARKMIRRALRARGVG